MSATTPTPIAEPPALREVAARVEASLSSLLDAEVHRWSGFDPALTGPTSSLRSFVLDGGKRLRPSFCHWGGVAAGGDPEDESLVRAGVALELLHAFALLHDDVMDASASRRGARTTHLVYADEHARDGLHGESRRFGEGVAVLLGDLAHALADRALGPIPDSARQVWNELRIEVDAGQLLDLIGTANGGVDEAAARRIARCKSGRYTVERPLHLGSALAGGTTAHVDALSAYGGPLGEAFQLRDDLLGAFGTAEQTGKPVGDDLREGKPTVLLAIALDRANRAQLGELRQVGDSRLSAEAVSRVQQILVETGACAAVEANVLELRGQAIQALASPAIAVSAREPLADLAFFVTERHS